MLPLPDLAGLITCPSCGRVTRVAPTEPTSADPGAPSEPRPSGGWAPPPVAAPPPGGSWGPAPAVEGAPRPDPPRPSGRSGDGGAGASKAARRIGCGLVPVVIVVAIALVIISAVRSCDLGDVTNAIDAASGSDAITLSGTVNLLPSEPDASTTDLVAVTQRSDGGSVERRISRISFGPDGAEQVWESDPVSDDASRLAVAVSGDTLFAGIGTDVYALDIDTGERRWSTEVRDEITFGCGDCFVVARERLVVRTADAYLTAFGTASAEPQWTRRLTSPQGTTWKAGEHLLVVDDAEDGSEPTPVSLVDASNGKTIRTVRPSCPEGEGSGPWVPSMGPNDTIHPVAGSEDVVAAFGFGDACVVRWSPTSGEVRWTSRLTGAGSLDEEGWALGAKDLVVQLSGSQLVTVDLGSGKAALLEPVADASAEPTVIIGRTLVGATTSTRGTTKGGIAGWDLTSGERRWAEAAPQNAQLVSEGRYRSSDALFDSSPRFTVVRSADAVRLFTFEGTERTFTVHDLDPATGELGSPIRRAFLTRYDSGTVSLTVDGNRGGRLVITIDNLVQALPVTGRGEVVSFPDLD